MDLYPKSHATRLRARRKPDKRYELPRTTLQGGDPIRGGKPSGSGHAGRAVLTRMTALQKRIWVGTHSTTGYRAFRAFAATLLLALLQLAMTISCSPSTAFAASGYDPHTVTLSAPDRHQLDGHEAYCADVTLNPPPVGSSVSYWESGTPLLDYVLYHSDGGPDPQFSWEPTRYAVWTIIHDNPIYLDTYVSGEKMPEDFSNQVKALYFAALDWVNKGGVGPERGCSRIYAAPASIYQPLAMCVPTRGDIALQKTTSLASISAGDALYTLAGARYDIYADEACSRAVASMTTDGSGKARVSALEQGTYFVRESAAPVGFAIDNTTYKVSVSPLQTSFVAGGYVSDQPLYASVGKLVRKGDAQTVAQGSLSQAQGDATLAGAHFTLTRYANASGDTSGTPSRSWVIQTDANGIATLDDAHLVSGDEPYRDANGTIVLPLGSYAIEEQSAPEGYALGGQRCRFIVEQAGSRAVVRNLEGPTPPSSQDSETRFLVCDDVVRGGVRLGKVDRQRGDHVAQGAARLEGARMAIELTSEQPVAVKGTTYQKGSIVATLTLGADGCTETSADALPYGSYVAYETDAPEGYLPTSRDAWSMAFQIREPNVIVDLSDSAHSVPDLVKRGDLSFVKVDGHTMQRLANVPFAIESLTTGERHVMVSDDNGQCSTHASFNAHTNHTNANDALLDEEPAGVPMPEAGIWFSGGCDREVEVDDSLGALPYDTYRVSELRCEANTDHELASFQVRVSRDQFIIDGGTVDDHALPSLQTRLACVETSEAAERWSLIDTVYLNDLESGGHGYELRGMLHLVNEDGSDGGVLLDDQGQELASSVSFEATAPFAQIEVPFTLDVHDLHDRTVVCFEELWRDGELIASHTDVTDTDQSLSIPTIHTSLADRDGEKEIFASGPVTLVDTVRYEGLVPNKSYRVSGTLVDKNSGEPVCGADGEPLRSEQTFVTPEAAGNMEITFSFDGDCIVGKSVVAFESLFQDDVELAVHADLTDEDQTVTAPAIQTVASDRADGDRHLPASEETQLIDTVSYQGLIPGETYTLTGTLMHTDTGEALKAGEDAISSEVSFTPQEASGSVEVPFTIDARGLAGQRTTIFERLSRNARLVAHHEDLSADKQTLSVPTIGTLAQSATGEKAIEPAQAQRIVDLVRYEGLTPGQTYQLIGELHLRDEQGQDGGVLTDKNGDPVVASAELTPASPSGELSLTFEFDATQLGGKDLVAFERLLAADAKTLVAAHEDITDGDQSVHVSQPPTPELPNKPTAQPASQTPVIAANLPKTGDIAAPVAGFVLMALFALGMGHALRRHERKHSRSFHARHLS